MADIWKKPLTNPGGIRIILALLYGLATFGIPLSHTCQLADKDIHHHSECTSHLLHSDSNVEVHHTAIFNQNSLSEKADSHDMYCPACLYLLNYKSFKPGLMVSLISIEITAKLHILSQINFTKQFVLLSSIALRAPPIIPS
jgi:hypothetical protein